MKWIYPNVTMAKYARENNVPYHALLYFMKTAKEITEETLQKFKQTQMIKKDKKKIQEALTSVLNDDSITNCKECASVLHIDFSRVEVLKEKGYSRREIMIYTWFYFDKENASGKKILSIRKFKKLINPEFLNQNPTLLDLIVKSRLGDPKALEQLFILEHPFFKSISEKQHAKRKEVSATKEDLLYLCYIHLKKLLDKICYTNSAQIGKFISVSIEGLLINHIKNENKIKTQDIETTHYTKNFLEKHWGRDPLNTLMQKEIKETSKKALENLEAADQNLIYDLYYASHSFLSVYPILENWIDGADICSSVERFQKEFLRIYQKEEL